MSPTRRSRTDFGSTEFGALAALVVLFFAVAAISLATSSRVGSAGELPQMSGVSSGHFQASEDQRVFTGELVVAREDMLELVPYLRANRVELTLPAEGAVGPVEGEFRLEFTIPGPVMYVAFTELAEEIGSAIAESVAGPLTVDDIEEAGIEVPPEWDDCVIGTSVRGDLNGTLDVTIGGDGDGTIAFTGEGCEDTEATIGGGVTTEQAVSWTATLSGDLITGTIVLVDEFGDRSEFAFEATLGEAPSGLACPSVDGYEEGFGSGDILAAGDRQLALICRYLSEEGGSFQLSARWDFEEGPADQAAACGLPRLEDTLDSGNIYGYIYSPAQAAHVSWSETSPTGLSHGQLGALVAPLLPAAEAQAVACPSAATSVGGGGGSVTSGDLGPSDTVGGGDEPNGFTDFLLGDGGDFEVTPEEAAIAAAAATGAIALTTLVTVLLSGGATPGEVAAVVGAVEEERGRHGDPGSDSGPSAAADLDEVFGEAMGAPPIDPAALGLPAVDAWGEPVIVQNGEYAGGEIGQIWWDGDWIDPDDARDKLREGYEAVAARDAQRETFWAESLAVSDAWLRAQTAANEAEAAAERAAIERHEDAWEQLERVGDIALGHDFGDIFERTQEGVFDEDGLLDVERVEELARATRNRIGRDIAAPDDELAQGWVEDFVTNTAHDVAHSTAIRLGTGVLTGGSSEIFYQSLSAAERMQAAVNRAVDSGQEYTTTDALRTGMRVLVEENLPINTIRVMQDPNATWGDVALAGVIDIATAAGSVETVRNVAGSLHGARTGASLVDIATHRAPGLFDDVLRRSGEGDQLWRDPMDVDWQTGGPRAGLDLDGLHTRGATPDGRSASGLARPPQPELNPPGGVQTRLPEEWGMRRPDAIHMRQVAEEELVQFTVRPATARAPELLDADLAVPKPPEIKVKTVNEIDIEYLGRPAHTDGMAAHFDPPMPGSPPGVKPPDMDDDLWGQVMDRYRQRKVEYGDNIRSVRDLDGWTVDADGVLRNPEGKAATGDYDLFEITNFDGTPVSKAVRDRVVARLMGGPANAQHGAHLDWPEIADLSPKELDIYNRIVRGHQAGGEALIQFGPGQPRIATTFTDAPEIQ